jgi:predicted porin
MVAPRAGARQCRETHDVVYRNAIDATAVCAEQCSLAGTCVTARVYPMRGAIAYVSVDSAKRSTVAFSSLQRGNLMYKKTLLAAALLAGFAGAAQAQSSVTLYGLADIGYVHRKIDGLGSSNLLSSGNESGSRWGLQGTEDLGNGLKANFMLESGFTLDDGKSAQGSRLFGRQSWAGLSGAFGDVRFGRQVSVTSEFFGAIDPFGASFNAANVGNVFLFDDTVRDDNTLKYLSPNVAGFQVGVNYSTNRDGQERAGTSNNTRHAGVAGRYTNGPVLLAVSYDQLRYANGRGGREDKGESWQVGGVYDFGILKIHAQYADQDGLGTDLNTGPTIAQRDTKAYLLGVSVPLGNGRLFGDYRKASDWDIDGFSMGYSYAVSKRTDFYAYYSGMDNLGSRGQVTGGDVTTREVGVGMRHKF